MRKGFWDYCPNHKCKLDEKKKEFFAICNSIASANNIEVIF